MIKGIIFDMDGVLVLGANENHVKAWEAAFKQLHIDAKVMDAKKYGEFEGARGDEILEVILRDNQLAMSDEVKNQVYALKKEIFTKLDDPYTPGVVKDLVHTLHQRKYKLLLASGNNRSVIDAFLKKQQLEEVFDFTITGDEIQRGKPDPEIFLKAWQKTGLPKHELVIIENAPYGIRAAKAAGIFTIAITSTLPRNLLEQADEIIDDIGDIMRIINALQ